MVDGGVVGVYYSTEVHPMLCSASTTIQEQVQLRLTSTYISTHFSEEVGSCSRATRSSTSHKQGGGVQVLGSLDVHLKRPRLSLIRYASTGHSICV